MYDKIKDIKEPITFCDIKTHTILVDDRRLLIKSTNEGLDGNFDITENEIGTAIMKINPEYKIKYEDSHIKDDIIVAYIPDESASTAAN